MTTNDCKQWIDRGKINFYKDRNWLNNWLLDFDQINAEILQVEKKLKESVAKLYDAEKRPEIRGLHLKALSRDEREQLDQLLEPFTWASSVIFVLFVTDKNLEKYISYAETTMKIDIGERCDKCFFFRKKILMNRSSPLIRWTLKTSVIVRCCSIVMTVDM